ncbi:hypothetical protein TNIN_298091 [Trichonephila inaurata madagascariensis]|uniref:Uncharacterized protein n=1 Tax=Trichonephila inaurata madagascariensis TaxID=2747483 RepID=A0A8X7BNT2_9ARAC|nr:hypothetical protein TNIN_298091 [Trichonephila inaurata madagascariensis]
MGNNMPLSNGWASTVPHVRPRKNSSMESKASESCSRFLYEESSLHSAGVFALSGSIPRHWRIPLIHSGASLFSQREFKSGIGRYVPDIF